MQYVKKLITQRLITWCLKMSYLSLPRVLSNISSRNFTDKNSNFLSLNRSAGHEMRQITKVYSTLSLNETAERRKRILNRNGSISNQHFRGVHKHLLESHTKVVCHSMTVSIFLNAYCTHEPIENG